jgi:NAD(P) transhydrogenase subunit alpha
VKVAVLKETLAGECRVGLIPDMVSKLIGPNVEIRIQSAAGERAYFSDHQYQEKGAVIENSFVETLDGADIILKVQPPSLEEAKLLPAGSAIVSFMQPAYCPDIVDDMAKRQITVFSLDLLPRISRAQSMDALSSQATVAGYAAILTAAQKLPKFFPMFMTAAGTVPPAKVLVMGTGVAGLQAIATARRLGAVVNAYDVRSAASQEVASLGANFIKLELETQEGEGGYAREQTQEFLDQQRELIASYVKLSDVVVTTAMIPGKPAPVLVTRQMVETMQRGSVIVDLAASAGGNCEITVADTEVFHNGVQILGPTNLPSSMPLHASFLYSKNITNFILPMIKEGDLEFDFEDEIMKSTCITHNGEILHKPTLELLEKTKSEKTKSEGSNL